MGFRAGQVHDPRKPKETGACRLPHRLVPTADLCVQDAQPAPGPLQLRIVRNNSSPSPADPPTPSHAGSTPTHLACLRLQVEFRN